MTEAVEAHHTIEVGHSLMVVLRSIGIDPLNIREFKSIMPRHNDVVYNRYTFPLWIVSLYAALHVSSSRPPTRPFRQLFDYAIQRAGVDPEFLSALLALIDVRCETVHPLRSFLEQQIAGG